MIDCHCHLSFLDLQEAQKVIEPRTKGLWVMGGYQPSEWEHQVEIKNKFPNNVKTCFGLHPWYIKSDEFDQERDLGDLKAWVDQGDLVGEVGLDFFGDDSVLRKETQINLFEKQLDLTTKKPFVFHIVQAHGKALEILKNFSVKGFVHSFSGSIEVAEQYFNQGILLSFGPNILNENFKKAIECLKALPPEAILIESDAPSNPLDRSDPNEQLKKVYQKAAELREISVDELSQIVQQNFNKLTHLSK